MEDESDNNNIDSWGYDVELINSSKWNEIKKITENYVCDVPSVLHTSVQYSCYDDYYIDPFIKNMIVDCKLIVADIRSSNPTDWCVL